VRQLIEQLLQNPGLVLLGLVWIVASIAGSIQRVKRQQQRTQSPLPPSEDAAGRRPTPTAEEIAAEMRRALGLDPKPQPQQQAPKKPQPRPEPRRVPIATGGERPPQPLQPRELGKVTTHVSSHVGERLEQRRDPQSGAVGAQQLGTLGGRAATRGRRGREGGSELVDLHDLPRAIVLREIFDQPLSLREPRV